MQRAVIWAVHSSSPDPLAEQDLAEDFEEILATQRVAPDSSVLCMSLFRSSQQSRDLADAAEKADLRVLRTRLQ